VGEAAGNDLIEKKVVAQFHNKTAQTWTQCGMAEATIVACMLMNINAGVR